MNRKIIIFIVISFTFSWIVALAIWILGINKGENRLILTLLGVVYMFGPAIGAIVSQKVSGEKVLSLGVSFKPNIWWLIGISLTLAISLLNIIISHLLGSGFNSNWEQFKESLYLMYGKDQASGSILGPVDKLGKLFNYNVFIFYLFSIIMGVIAGLSLNSIIAFGEELGWRGLMYNELKDSGFVKSSFLIGLTWGVWHAPIISLGHNFPMHPFEGIFMMIVFCIAMSFIMNYFRYRSNSVVLSSMMHGTFNGVAGLYIYTNYLKNDILYNITGVSGIIAIILVLLFILIFDRSILKEKLQ
ncbi:MAG: CPBP family intramembrane metalloprotease [Spirochaetes bacterium]|nr:CPBP family intramembrane metalloprotease [Spirochaetota bacterium]